MANASQTFTPRPLADQDPIKSPHILSGNYFKTAAEFRSMAADDKSRWPGHFYVFPAVVIYTAAFEAFLQEHLAFSRFHLETSDSPTKDADLERIDALKMQQKPYNDFKDWVKEIFRLYDPKNAGLDPNCEKYQNLIALRELRNSVIHYNPTFIEHAVWPARLEQALHRSKVQVMNAGWVTNFLRVEVADWAHATIRAAVELFSRITGAENPFTTTDADGMLNWEYVRSNPASQPTPASGCG
ncbi:MAG: hypothetical protein ABI648_09435 [Betaproteobacteria bacterium]